MTENEISKIIVDSAYKAHTTLGPGLLESVYEKVLAHEIEKHSLKVGRQVAMKIEYDDIVFDEGYRADLIVELKSVEVLAPVHYKQLLTYLRLADKRLGL